MLPCTLGGDKHAYRVQPSPYNFLVFKCTLCPKYCYIPKVIFYKQMMALSVYNPHLAPKEKGPFARYLSGWHSIPRKKFRG